MALLGSSWSSCFLLFLLVSSLFVSLFVFVCVCFNYVFVLQLIADDIEHHPCGNSAKMHWRHWHWKRRGISKRSGHRPCEINMGIVQQSMHLAVMRSHKHKENNGESWRIKEKLPGFKTGTWILRNGSCRAISPSGWQLPLDSDGGITFILQRICCKGLVVRQQSSKRPGCAVLSIPHTALVGVQSKYASTLKIFKCKAELSWEHQGHFPAGIGL